jgi:hypothetical protein
MKKESKKLRDELKQQTEKSRKLARMMDLETGRGARRTVGRQTRVETGTTIGVGAEVNTREGDTSETRTGTANWREGKNMTEIETETATRSESGTLAETESGGGSANGTATGKGKTDWVKHPLRQ